MTRAPAGNRRTEATALADWVKPQLTKLVDQPPEGPEWLHELEFDGYRMHARLERGAVRLLTRTGLDWTYKIRRCGYVAPGATGLSGRGAVRCPI
jgi:ATP-dependent DNA ligase